MVESWFDRDGVDLTAARGLLESAVDALGLEVKDMGARNHNEQGKLIYNQVRILVNSKCVAVFLFIYGMQLSARGTAILGTRRCT